MDMFNFLRSKTNINRVADLESVDIRLCGSIIFLQQKLPKHLIVKLKEIIGKVAITRLVLRDCFEDASQLVGVLQALEENSNVKSLHLDLRDNPHDMECAREICKLTRREIFQSLALPEGMEEACTAEILHEINNTKAQLTELDLSESVLNEDSLKYLSEILKHRNVYEKLVLKGCVGVANTTLTTKDLEKLQEAEKTGRPRAFWGSNKVKIVEFNHVLHISEQDLDPSEYEVEAVEEKIRPFFKGKLGKVEKVVRYIARSRKGGPLRLLRTGKKRPAEEQMEAASKVPRREEIDNLAALLDNLGKSQSSSSSSSSDQGNNFFTNNANTATGQQPAYLHYASCSLPVPYEGTSVDDYSPIPHGSPPPAYQDQRYLQQQRTNYPKGRFEQDRRQNQGVKTRSYYNRQQHGQGDFSGYQFSFPVDRNQDNQFCQSNAMNQAFSPTKVVVNTAVFRAGLDVPDGSTTENNRQAPDQRHPEIKTEYEEDIGRRQGPPGYRRQSDPYRQDQERYVAPPLRMSTRFGNQQIPRQDFSTKGRDNGHQKPTSMNNIGQDHQNNPRGRQNQGGKSRRPWKNNRRQKGAPDRS